MGNSFRFLCLSLYQVEFLLSWVFVLLCIKLDFCEFVYLGQDLHIDDLKSHYLLACSTFSPGVKGKAVWQTFLLAFIKSQLHSVGSVSSYS